MKYLFKLRKNFIKALIIKKCKSEIALYTASRERGTY